MSNSLHQLQQKAQQLSKDRQKNPQQMYHEGLEKMALFFQDFHKSEHFKRAFECFTRALQRDRTNPDLYHALAYQWILLGDYTNSLECLKAMELFCKISAKDSPLMEVLQQRARYLFPELAAEEAQPVASASAAPPPPEVKPIVKIEGEGPGEDFDYDGLYEKVNKQIYTNIQFMMRLNFSGVTLDINELKKLKAYYEKYNEIIQQLHKDVSLLEYEMETQELRVNLDKMDMILNRIKSTFNASQKARKIRKSILGLNREVTEELKSLNRAGADTGASEQRLETLLDQCDEIADQLDALEKEGVSITLLENDYSKMVAGIETLQDKIDDILAP